MGTQFQHFSHAFRFNPLLHDGRPRGNETRARRLQAGQTGALSIRIVQGDHQVLGSRPVQTTHIRRAEARAGCTPGKPRV